MTCERCQGTRSPLQCRNSAAWRKAQGAPDECPHGLPIGYSPDDVRRGDYAAPVVGGRGSVVNGLTADGIWRGANPCRYLIVVPTGGCCDNVFYCDREGRTGRSGRKQIKPGACRDCPSLTTDN